MFVRGKGEGPPNSVEARLVISVRFITLWNHCKFAFPAAMVVPGFAGKGPSSLKGGGGGKHLASVFKKLKIQRDPADSKGN